MKPKEFTDMMKKDDDGEVALYLSKKHREGAAEVIDVGMDFIGKKVGEIYDECNPEALKIIVALEGFLSVFIEHASDIPKVKAMLKGNFA